MTQAGQIDRSFPPAPELLKALDRLAAGRAPEALPSLEWSAAFLLEERLERRLFPLEHLRDLGLGQLVDDYVASAELLQGVGTMLVSDPDQQIAGTVARLGVLTNLIRSIDRFASFLAWPDLERVSALRYPDPVVYLVAGPESGWGVLLEPGTPPRISALRLQGFTRASVIERALSSWQLFAAELDFQAAADRLDKVAAWCWDTCMATVCASLPSGSRLTIIPLEWVNLLPLQVAFTKDADSPCGRRYALDQLTISYAPNLRIAAYARRQSSFVERPGVIAFAPNAGGEDLPNSGPEARYVSGLYESGPPLIDFQATPAALQASLNARTITHFAGHARASPSVSWASFLRFGETLLTLKDLADSVGDADAELVVLSACTSTLGSAVHTEQAVTIGNVLLATGVHGTVATQWRILDDATALLACRFHEILRQSPDHVPEALQEAQQWLRDASPTTLHEAARSIGIEIESETGAWRSPIAWGAFVHAGSTSSRGQRPTGYRPLPRPGPFGFDPRDLAAHYFFPRAFDGSGASIAIVHLSGGYQRADLETYFAAAGRPTPSVEEVPVGVMRTNPVADPDPNGGLAESLQILGSIAPGSRLVVYLADNTEMGVVDGLSEAIGDRTRDNSIICLTWGIDEAEVNPNVAKFVDELVKSAVIMGKVVCAPAGSTTADGVLEASFPGTHPYVLSCAATRAVPDSDRLIERPTPAYSDAASSQLYPRPRWQVALPRSNRTSGRLVPDVSCLGDDVYGYRCYLNGAWVSASGPTAAACMWAGLFARLQQALGRPWGMVPDLYNLLGPAGAFAPVEGPPSPGTPTWDERVGWGVPDGERLLAILRNPPAS